MKNGRKINRLSKGPKLPFEEAKTPSKKMIKGHDADEVIEIKRSEYDDLMAAFESIKGLVDLDVDKIADTIDKVEQLFNGEVEVEIVNDNEEPEVIEEEFIEEEVDANLIEEPEVIEEEFIEGEDADIVEIMKDPIKKKAVLEFLKLEDNDALKGEDNDELEKGHDAKKEIKRKTLKKAGDSTPVADFTSRFTNGAMKANDSELEKPKKDLSTGYKSRFGN